MYCNFIYHAKAIYVSQICPSNATLHIYVPLYFYHTFHVDPTLLHTSIKNQYTSNLFTIPL